MLKRDIGNIGEDIAVKFLKKQKYKIIERNFNVPNAGEIDIIATEGGYLVFIEVRLRKDSGHGSGAETVDIFKQRKIIKAAKAYIKLHRLENVPARFDVVSVTAGEVELIKDAFCVESEKF